MWNAKSWSPDTRNCGTSDRCGVMLSAIRTQLGDHRTATYTPTSSSTTADRIPTHGIGLVQLAVENPCGLYILLLGGRHLYMSKIVSRIEGCFFDCASHRWISLGSGVARWDTDAILMQRSHWLADKSQPCGVRVYQANALQSLDFPQTDRVGNMLCACESIGKPFETHVN